MGNLLDYLPANKGNPYVYCHPTETELMRHLGTRCGHHQAVKLPVLARLSGIPMREIQDIVAHLVIDHGIRIGSGSRGLFMIETAEELEAACATLRHRALSTLKHMAALRRQHLAELLGQLKLEV